jgi:hypothetical protein
VAEGGRVLGTMREIELHLPPAATRDSAAAN